MDIIYEENFYYSTYDSGAKYKVNGDKLSEIVLNDGAELDTFMHKKKLAEHGIILESSSERSGDRSECTATVKITNKRVLPVTIRVRNVDSYSSSGFDPEDYGNGPFEIKISEDENGKIKRQQLS